MTDEELKPFESYVCDGTPILMQVVCYTHRPQLNEKIKQTSPEARRLFENDRNDWEVTLKEYRELIPCESSIHRLKEVDIPSLETQIRAQDGLLPSLAEAAEKV
jgi:hypothetical protein